MLFHEIYSTYFQTVAKILAEAVEHTCRFSADVYDASELIPWIRTFICRITDISISNKALETQFKEDLQAMYEMYGLKEEE